MSRTSGYYELREALQEPGCALCRLEAVTTERFLDGLLYGQVNDPDLDEILTKTRNSVDPAERQKWVDEAQRRIVEQAYVVPLYIPQNFYALNQRVNGEVFSDTTLNLYLEDAYIE